MNVNLTAFREPRGVMRVLQFIFAICAFSTISGYTGEMTLTACSNPESNYQLSFGYPFKLSDVPPVKVTCPAAGGKSGEPENVYLVGDFSSDAQFFVASGVLAFLYCLGIVVVYGLFEDKYQSNTMLPLVDFLLTTVLAVLWLSSSAAWANSLSSIKAVTDGAFMKEHQCRLCQKVWTASFSSLNISVLLGFLNFFLWASDLWFLYKETHWFKMRQETAGGV